MPNTDHILIVDDSPTQQQLMGSVLESDGFSVRMVSGASEALAAMESELPMLVVTDLEMPGMSGLELVQTLRGIHPSLPVVLTTARGSEDIAAEALRNGAASYVPKRGVSETLPAAVRQVLSATELIRSAKEIGRFATRSLIELEIGNEESLVPKVIARMEMALVELNLFDDGGRMQVAMALDEALLNAIVHGNLEVPSTLREVDNGAAYFELIDQRKEDPKFRDRRVQIVLEATSEQAVFTITDQGPGYDRDCLADSTDEEHIEGLGGRGLLMIEAFMDEVEYNACGNQIVMTKRPLKDTTDDSE